MIFTIDTHIETFEKKMITTGQRKLEDKLSGFRHEHYEH